MNLDLLKDIEELINCKFYVYKNKKNVYPITDQEVNFEGLFLVQHQNNIGLYSSKPLSYNEKSLLNMMLDKFSFNYYELFTKEDGYLRFMDELILPYKVIFVKTKKENFEIVNNILQNLVNEIIVVTDNQKYLILLVKKSTYESTNFLDIIAELESETLDPIKLLISEDIVSYRSFYPAFLNMFENFEMYYSYNQNQKFLELEKLLITQLIIKTASKTHEDYKYQRLSMLDEELIMSALEFLRNDLNVTQTAQKLYVHRNTLIYRISKIEQLTGYDIRKFNDAVNFYIVYLSKKVLDVKF
jgi:sugar diacid utilization regulator